jgi:hypothetical protein
VLACSLQQKRKTLARQPQSNRLEKGGRMTALIGETIARPGYDATRVKMFVDAEVRAELRNLLYMPFMRGVGYSEFIKRAIDRAYEEADEQGVLA